MSRAYSGRELCLKEKKQKQRILNNESMIVFQAGIKEKSISLKRQGRRDGGHGSDMHCGAYACNSQCLYCLHLHRNER